MCLAMSNNLLLVLQDAPKRIFILRTRDLLVRQRHFFFLHPPSPFHGNFCNCNSIGISTASRFQAGSASTVIHSVKRRLLRNRPGSTLGPLATSCAKDYKAHSLQQTCFAESPNRVGQCTTDRGSKSNTELVSWCFEPSQPHRVVLGLNPLQTFKIKLSRVNENNSSITLC